jgi:putative Mn2+ efflux pump MntP
VTPWVLGLTRTGLHKKSNLVAKVLQEIFQKVILRLAVSEEIRIRVVTLIIFMMKPAFKSTDLTVAAPKEIYNWRVYILAIVSSMGAFLFGYDLAFIGTSITLTPFIRYLDPRYVLSTKNQF